MNLTIGEMFAGAASFSFAGEAHGMQTLWLGEIAEVFHPTYHERFSTATIFGKLQETDPESLKKPSIITAGFPCQDISRARPGGEGIEGKRSGLYSEIIRYSSVLRPDYIVLENSPDLLAKGFGQVLGDLAEIGYNAEWEVLAASSFSAAHKRERLFTVAYPMRIGLDSLPIFTRITVQEVLDESKRWINIQREAWRSVGLQVLPEDLDKLECMDDGLPPELVEAGIKAFGNSIYTGCAYFILGLIKRHSQLICKR